jgi:hypothetical protein
MLSAVYYCNTVGPGAHVPLHGAREVGRCGVVAKLAPNGKLATERGGGWCSQHPHITPHRHTRPGWTGWVDDLHAASASQRSHEPARRSACAPAGSLCSSLGRSISETAPCKFGLRLATVVHTWLPHGRSHGMRCTLTLRRQSGRLCTSEGGRSLLGVKISWTASITAATWRWSTRSRYDWRARSRATSARSRRTFKVSWLTRL